MDQHDPHRDEPRDNGGPPTASSARAPEGSVLGDPTHVGPYRILGRLGEGGMGVVYLAEQSSPVRRRVALKVIKLGMDSAEVLARFEAERQALALMDHPHVARVLDAGATTAGRPYFAMEHVPGVPITEYCDTQRLSVPERLNLFIQVCGALQHAHQKGVIHRDIKPSNVLVELLDGKPIAKVIDFGVAKALNQRLTERTLFTRQGQLVGTPEYMSPEQAEMSALDVDTRTDIYSLGVLLYELLVGKLPFDPETIRQAAFAEIQRIIREVDPPKPSTRVSTLDAEEAKAVVQRRHADRASLVRLLHDDLDWITMKAMEKDRTRRYASASELAADIERHLKSEPVLAGPPSAAYRLRKFVKRRRGLVIGVGAVAAALLLGLAAAVWQAREADRARGLAEAERARAEAALATAQKRLNLGLGMGTSIVTTLEGSIRRLPGSIKARKLIVETTATYLDGLSQGSGDDPQVLTALADLLEAVADLQGGLRSGNEGDTAGAMVSFRRTLAMRERVVAARPGDPSARVSLIETRLSVVTLMRRVQDPPADLLAQLDRAREDLQTVRSLSPAEPSLRRLEALILLESSDAKSRAGRREEAIADCRSSVSLRQTLSAEAPDSQEATRDLAVAQITLSHHLVIANDRRGAYDALHAALPLFRALRVADPDDTTYRRDTAMCLLALARVAVWNDHADEARACIDEGLPEVESLVRENPDDVRLRKDVPYAYERRGDQLRDSDTAGAINAYGEGLEHATKLSEADPADDQMRRQLYRLHAKLSKALVDAGDEARAVDEANAALSIAEGMRAAGTETRLLDVLVAESNAFVADAHRAASKKVGAPASERRDHLRQAAEHYAAAEAIYARLQRDGALPPAKVRSLDAIRDARKQCEDAL